MSKYDEYMKVASDRIHIKIIYISLTLQNIIFTGTKLPNFGPFLAWLYHSYCGTLNWNWLKWESCISVSSLDKHRCNALVRETLLVFHGHFCIISEAEWSSRSSDGYQVWPLAYRDGRQGRLRPGLEFPGRPPAVSLRSQTSKVSQTPTHQCIKATPPPSERPCLHRNRNFVSYLSISYLLTHQSLYNENNYANSVVLFPVVSQWWKHGAEKCLCHMQRESVCSKVNIF